MVTIIIYNRTRQNRSSFWGAGHETTYLFFDPNLYSSGVVDIFAGSGAILALKDDGYGYAWGRRDSGAVIPGGRVDLSSGVKQVIANGGFTILTNDGKVIYWGKSDYKTTHFDPVETQIQSGVDSISEEGDHIVARKSDDSFVYWSTY